MGFKTQDIWLGLWRRAAPTASLPVGRLKVRPVVSDAAMRALTQWRPTWKTHLIARMLDRRPGTFVDVGANVGQTLLDFLSAGSSGAYVGFEPNPTCHKHLADFIAANALEQCVVVPAALGDRTGIATFHAGSEVDAGGTMLESLRPQLRRTPTTVCMFRFDALAATLSQEPISVIKIDVEGAELEVLRGAELTLADARPWIICEVLHRDAFADAGAYSERLANLRRFIAEAGYEIVRIVPAVEGATVAALEDVDDFPDKVWDGTSERECDYLLVPAGQKPAARRLL